MDVRQFTDNPRTRLKIMIPLGTKFGKLTVIGYAGPEFPGWICECDCGDKNCKRQVKIKGNHLLTGRNKSCGCQAAPRDMSILERVKRKAVITDGGCWLWIKIARGNRGGISNRGRYSRTTVGGGKRFAIHRRVWEEIKGPIPGGLCVLHNCPTGDDDRCVNPDHMFLGTRDENLKDAARKNRIAYGPRVGSAKLTDEMAVEIYRKHYAEGKTEKSLIAEYESPSQCRIAKVLRRETWRRATEEIAKSLGYPELAKHKKKES